MDLSAFYVAEKGAGRHTNGNTEGAAIYLYCCARSGPVANLSGRGIDGRSPLFLWPCQEIAAVVSQVSLADFCGPEAEAHLQSLEWVAARACRHEEVVEGVMRRSPVLPVRMGTLFSSFESLEDRLRSRYEAILQFLHRVAGQEEWGVTLWLHRAAARAALRDAALAGGDASAAAVSPGAQYLRDQRLRMDADRELGAWIKAACRDAAERLNQHATDSRARAFPAGSKAAGEAEPIAKWAFLFSLLRREDASQPAPPPAAFAAPGVASFPPEPRARAGFLAAIEQMNTLYQPQGLQLAASGPWPPYSFVPPLEPEEA